MLGGTIDVDQQAGRGLDLHHRCCRTGRSKRPRRAGRRGDRALGIGSASAGLTVLVVDDDPTVHDLLSATLGKEGYRLLHARDGAEALEILRKTPPDIVTLDVMMPKVDGWSVLGIMKSDPALDHIPVIMLTIVDDRNLGYTLGASEFMTKPIDRTLIAPGAQVRAVRRRQPSVLIVDDDPDVRDLVSSDARGRRPQDRGGRQRPRRASTG